MSRGEKHLHRLVAALRHRIRDYRRGRPAGRTLPPRAARFRARELRAASIGFSRLGGLK